MGIGLAVLTVGEVSMAKAVHLGGLSPLLNVWPGLVLLVVCLVYCIKRPLPKLIESCLLAIWAVVLSDTLSLLIQIAGRSPRPLVDHELASIDAQGHFSTLFFVHLISQAPAVKEGLAIVYAALPLLIIASVIIPPILGRSDASRRFVVGIVLAAILTAASSALWPAIGPWTTQDFKPTKEQAGVDAYLTRLRSNAPVDLDESNAGIVSFPSFHVVLAVLSAVALGAIRRLRACVWTLAGLTCVSTITTGWHYGIDVLGGLVLAIFAIAVTNRIPGDCSQI
jgi:membrane-associated phospholipid phosphatase